MNRVMTVCGSAVLMVFGLTAIGLAEDRAMTDELLLPPNAKPGECYARVFVPPQYRTESKQVLKRAAYQTQEIVPSQFEWVEETVLVKEASERLEVVPATYEWVEERLLVKPASKKIVDVPAEFETISEQVVDTEAQVIWKKGEGAITRLDNATGEIMCLVEVPATYKTVTSRVLKSPATTREVEIPAQYKTVRKQVMTAPPATRKVEIPAVYETVRVQKEVSPSRVVVREIPAEHQTVTNTVKVAEGRMEWQPVLCRTNVKKDTVMAVQQALAGTGHYAGPIDGIVGPQTLAALKVFQSSKGLPSGNLTYQTLEALGVRY